MTDALESAAVGGFHRRKGQRVGRNPKTRIELTIPRRFIIAAKNIYAVHPERLGAIRHRLRGSRLGALEAFSIAYNSLPILRSSE
jgi:hypothetical protein